MITTVFNSLSSPDAIDSLRTQTQSTPQVAQMQHKFTSFSHWNAKPYTSFFKIWERPIFRIQDKPHHLANCDPLIAKNSKWKWSLYTDQIRWWQTLLLATNKTLDRKVSDEKMENVEMTYHNCANTSQYIHAKSFHWISQVAAYFRGKIICMVSNSLSVISWWGDLLQAWQMVRWSIKCIPIFQLIIESTKALLIGWLNWCANGW